MTNTYNHQETKPLILPIVFYNCKLIPELDETGMLTLVKTVEPIESFEHHEAILYFRLEGLINNSPYVEIYQKQSDKALRPNLFQGFVSEMEAEAYEEETDYSEIKAVIEDALGIDCVAENPIHDIINSDQYARLMMDLRERWYSVSPDEIADDFEVLKNQTMGGVLLDIAQLSFSCLQRPYLEIVQQYNEYTFDDFLEDLRAYFDQ